MIITLRNVHFYRFPVWLLASIKHYDTVMVLGILPISDAQTCETQVSHNRGSV